MKTKVDDLNSTYKLCVSTGKFKEKAIDYESLRGLIEAYLLFDGIEADNHQCKNAYICFKHLELELN